ncbi:MAG TPA: anthranilate/aminodeoxychorismate synthase component II [Thermoanaerobaculia bacterium]|nr:anthranilate/aminodeoxychorismate synthase component II [Thermoanaerobaculia bacterium]
MRVLLLDHGDKFTPFLVKILKELEAECEVRPAEKIDFDEVLNLKPRRILMTPGPLAPEDCRVGRRVVQELAGQIPVLGLCLGMQVIALVAGARLLPSKKKPRKRPNKTPLRVRHDGKGIFEALPSPMFVSRYESPLIVEGGQEPPFLEFSAWSEEDGAVLGLRLSGLGVEGLQIGPETFLTQGGNDMLFNFLYRSQTW